jgi:HSP20 family molecular chaperone IbpA
MNADHRAIKVEVGAAPSPEPAPPPAGELAIVEPPITLTPLTDIYEGPEGLVLEADLPGATEHDLHVQLEENVLTLHARAVNPAPAGAKHLHEEYSVGDFSRSFILSDEVERTKISAELKNGVLRLTMPKSDRAKTRRIEIKS